MATGVYTASELKQCRNGTSWRTDKPYASVGQSFTYDSVSRIGYLGFNFNLSGKYITKISFTFKYDAIGLGDWATKYIDFYRYVSSSSPSSSVGSYIGGFSSTGMYNCTSTFTFDSSSNAALFNGLKAYFEAGGSALIIKAPSTDSKTHSHGEYTDSYLQITEASVSIDYVDMYKISYNVNGGGGSIGDTWLPSGIAGKTTTSTPSVKADTSANANTVTYNGNGGTASKASDTNRVTYKYQFAGWNTAANGTGASYGSNADISITDNIILYAQWSVRSTEYSQVTSATATKPSVTNVRNVTLNYNGNGTSNGSLSSSATTSYTCNGWYTATSGGTKRVNTGTAFTPNTETLYAQYTASTTAYNAVTLPTPTRTGHTFGGWVDGNGTVISSGGSYTPATSITLTAKWVPNQCTLSVVDRLNGEVKYSATVDYGTVYTLPNYGSKVIEISTGVYSSLYFNDTDSGYTGNEKVQHVQSYVFNNQFGKYENGYFSWADEGKEYYSAGDTVTITTNTEFAMVSIPDTLFIKFTTPPAPSATFGKRFQGWKLSTTSEVYSTNSQYIIYDPPAAGGEYSFAGIWINSLDNYGKNLYFNVGGQMKQGTAYVKTGGEYKEAVAVFVKVNGIWKTKEG